MVGIKPDDFGVVIRYQGDEFTHTWLEGHFIALSHIYPGFMGKATTGTHFQLDPGGEDYFFLDQAVEDFKHSLDHILTDFDDTLDLDAFFDEADVVPFSVSSVFLCSVSTISLACS